MNRCYWGLVIVSVVAAFLSGLGYAQPQWVQDATSSSDQNLTTTVTSTDAQGAYQILTNWQEGWMEFTATGNVDLQESVNPGQAEYLALTSGRMLAYQKAAEFISGVQVQSHTQLDKGLVSQDRQTFNSRAFVEKAVIVKEDVTWVKSHGVDYPQATVVLGLLLHGENPDINLTSGLLNSFMNGLEEAGFDRPNNSQSGRNTKEITGLVVDLRRLNFSPVLFPLILVDDQEKQSVFPDPEIDRDYAVTHGIVAFSKSLEDAQAMDRLSVDGNVNVITVKPTRTDEARIYISTDDAAQIIGENIRTKYLDECRVVLVVD